MNQTWLKKIRVATALAFLALTTLLFVDFEPLSESYAPAVLYLQFVPSLLNFKVDPIVKTNFSRI